jgi:hypothetical protein
MIQLPKALGLTLCDQVLFEQGTQKPSLIGCFIGMAVDHFPSGPQKFDVFAALTDGLGEATIDLVVVHLESERQVYAQSMELTFQDPLKVVNLRIRVRTCAFPEAGSYVFALGVNGEELAQCRVKVYLSGEPS